MAAKKVLHMNAGYGETSYANNSGHQKTAMSKSLPVLDETLKDMFNDNFGFPKCFKMVDLGCASGPNTLLAMSHIMDTIGDLCIEKNINELPEFEVFLNDLPNNDFNNLFKSLPEKNGKERGRYFVYGLPGSFYGCLLPKKSLNFAYSSYSIHWLSQVPEGLEKKNEENIYIAMTSPSEVYEAYANQYKRDFYSFLSLRAEEIIPGGRMVLTFVGRSVEDPSIKDDLSVFTVLAETLAEMVAEGFVKMDALYSFNMPMYFPCIQEVEMAIQSEGSFTLDKSESYRVYRNDNTDDDAYQHIPLALDNLKRGKMVAHFIRAFLEPTLVSHFGSSIMDNLFLRYEKNFVEHLSKEDASSFNIVISLTRK